MRKLLRDLRRQNAGDERCRAPEAFTNAGMPRAAHFHDGFLGRERPDTGIECGGYLLPEQASRCVDITALKKRPGPPNK